MGAYFTHTLNNEWRTNNIQYSLIEESLLTPFTIADQRARAWREHFSWLVKSVHEPMFGEHFSLHDIYIQPRASTYVNNPRSRSSLTATCDSDGKMEVVDLHSELHRWLDEGDKEDAIKVSWVRGPGCGKSSLTRMFAMELGTTERHASESPSSLQPPDGDIETQVGVFISDQGILHDNPLERKTGPSRILLIFDGLDELAMQGREASETVQKFVYAVHKFVMSRNQSELHVQVLLSGRELVIQNLQGDFRKARQVYHVMPTIRHRMNVPHTMIRTDFLRMIYATIGG